MMARSYHRELWGAAYIINGGCSDDGFEYFRGWLILQGEKSFEDALKDPESLVEIAKCDVENEDILGLAVEAYLQQTGKEFPRKDVVDRFELKGTAWTEDEVYEKYPKLAEKFG